MKFLLDTHTFIWWVTDDPQLSTIARETIANPKHTILFSVINGWEIVIKQGTGKLTLPEPAETYIPSRITANRFIILPVNLPHILQVASLPNLHSVDRYIIQYPVNVIW